MLRVLRSALVVFGCAWFGVQVFAQHPSPGASVMGEGGWRKSASSRAMPTFPPRSLAAGAQGVAVAYVVTTPAGRMERVVSVRRRAS